MLSQYALGANEARLKREIKLEGYLDPLRPVKTDTVITGTNWQKYIGKSDYYHNYLNFFEEQVRVDGDAKSVVKYAFDPVLLPSFVSGAVHPLIHTAFGVSDDIIRGYFLANLPA